MTSPIRLENAIYRLVNGEEKLEYRGKLYNVSSAATHQLTTHLKDGDQVRFVYVYYDWSEDKEEPDFLNIACEHCLSNF